MKTKLHNVFSSVQKNLHRSAYHLEYLHIKDAIHLGERSLYSKDGRKMLLRSLHSGTLQLCGNDICFLVATIMVFVCGYCSRHSFMLYVKYY
jgi:hypothetical protein